MQQKHTLQSRVEPFHLCASYPKAKEGILPPRRQHVLCRARRNSGLGATAGTGTRHRAASMPHIIVLHMGDAGGISTILLCSGTNISA